MAKSEHIYRLHKSEETAKQIIALVISSIAAIDPKLYNQKQKKAWISRIDSLEKWMQALDDQLFYGHLIGHQLVGVISLRKDSCIDFLYVSLIIKNKG